ncbi:hypothetical protein EPA93_16905 [Ktedonosporobacter rubrisoli]|uniref:Uncharacterized protein n=1 Tax=Ktedonosporobacter rubrisoli TaxID=2509675 RepID=A0A4P6JQ90_KTERU|nr:hypothetical protein [Ktedonosporobacter rubrisoli]QBD77578.1 hypothetical protein EPA93_16905 [Ktedonosporobacter rubrisoli]
MSIMAFLVVLLIVGLTIGCGVVISMYLYSRGAIGTKRFGRVQRLRPALANQEAVAEEQFSMSIGVPNKGPESYLGKWVMIFLSTAVGLSLLIALLMSFMPR